MRAQLAPQERFDKLRADAVFRAGKNLADLAYANAYDGASAAVRSVLAEALAGERTLDLQYTPYGGATLTRRAVAEDLSLTHGNRFHWREIVMTPGAMSALCIAFRCVRNEGEANEVLVITPCWMDYVLYLENLGMRARPVPLTAQHRLDLPALRAAIGKNTRAIVLSQPANPTGHLYSAPELAELAALLNAQQTPPLWISDECHRQLLFAGARFTSPVELYDRTCVIFSFGKSHFIQGQRIGYVAVSPRMPAARAFAGVLEQTVRAMGFCTPTALMQRAVPGLLQLSVETARVEARSRRIARGLHEAGYEVSPADGTFFLYVKAPIDDDFAFVEALAREGILVLPSTIFHQRGFFRVAVTGSDAMIERALPVFARVRAQVLA